MKSYGLFYGSDLGFCLCRHENYVGSTYEYWCPISNGWNQYAQRCWHPLDMLVSKWHEHMLEDFPDMMLTVVAQEDVVRSIV